MKQEILKKWEEIYWNFGELNSENTEETEMDIIKWQQCLKIISFHAMRMSAE